MDTIQWKEQIQRVTTIYRPDLKWQDDSIEQMNKFISLVLNSLKNDMEASQEDTDRKRIISFIQNYFPPDLIHQMLLAIETIPKQLAFDANSIENSLGSKKETSEMIGSMLDSLAVLIIEQCEIT